MPKTVKCLKMFKRQTNKTKINKTNIKNICFNGFLYFYVLFFYNKKYLKLNILGLIFIIFV